MFSISTKYSQNFDFCAFLTSKKSELKKINKLIDEESAKKLRDKASTNKRGFTFVSQIKKSNFNNFYFFNVKDKSTCYQYQNIGGKIVNEALALKKRI